MLRLGFLSVDLIRVGLRFFLIDIGYMLMLVLCCIKLYVCLNF